MGLAAKRACWAALWIGLLATSPSAVAQDALSAEAKTALQEGIAAAKFQNWDSAQKYFDEALAAAPGAPEILFNLGLLNDRKGGAELVASAWYRAYLAALPEATNRAKVEARLIELHASAEAKAAKYMATAKEAAKQLAPITTVSTLLPDRGIDCQGGFRNLLRGEIASGRLEGVDEIIGWFQGNECQNDFLYAAVAALLTLQKSQEASLYFQRMSGPWKVSALTLFAAVKWSEGDKPTAVKLVEEAETLATQLLKGLGRSNFLDKYNALRLRSELAIAWCRVGNVAKAQRSFERIDPNTLAESIDGQSGTYLITGSRFHSAMEIVVFSLVLAGKDEEARAVARRTVSKIHDDNDWTKQNVQHTFEELVNHATGLMQNNPEYTAERAEFLLTDFYRLPLIDEHLWSSEALSVESHREAGESEYWIRLAKDPIRLQGDIYRDAGKFLKTASESDAANTVAVLSKGSADLLLGSRKIKAIAETWRKEGAGSVE